MGPIVLLKNFTFALAANQTFTTDWIPFPSEHRNAQLHYHLQSLTPTPATNGMSVDVETSYDTVEHPPAGSISSITAVGSDSLDITSGLQSLVGAVLTNDDSGALFGTISVWLQPKST